MYALPPSVAYIDLHTHHAKTAQDIFAIQNKYRDFTETETGRHYSMGLHPWYLANTAEQWLLLEQEASLPHVLAIGECGLDMVCATDHALQRAALQRQINLANQLSKPLIIHCVRAYPETLQLLRQAKVPAIFHGFNRKWSVAASILEQGHYISFGALLLQRPDLMQDVLDQIPAHKFFLETDDAQDDIRAIYKAAAAMRKTTEEVIILQLRQNFKDVFGI